MTYPGIGDWLKTIKQYAASKGEIPLRVIISLLTIVQNLGVRIIWQEKKSSYILTRVIAMKGNIVVFFITLIRVYQLIDEPHFGF